MISDEQIERWCAIAEAATRGPWRWRFGCVEQISDSGKGYPLDFYPDCETIQESQCHECGTRIGPSECNGQLFAAAREAVPALAAEVARLRGLVLRPLMEADVVIALREGHAERRAAVGDNAWASLLADRNRLRAALLEACDVADRAYRSMCGAARSPDHWPGTSERIAELRDLAGGGP